MSRFGNIDTQYFDASGKPLSGGLLYFYESGTTTDKTTYSDADQTTANTQPVTLEADGRQGDIFFDGSAKCVLKDSDDVTIDTLDPVGASITGDALSDWNALVTYDANDLVLGSDSRYYQAITSTNLNNDPTSTSGDWQEVRFIVEWDSAYTYLANALVIGSNGLLYSCTNGASLNDDPTTTPAEWATVGGVENHATLTTTAPSLDLANGNVFDITLTGNTTFVTNGFATTPTSGYAAGFTLIITQDSTERTITWPTSVDWDGGSAPDVPAINDVAIYTFFTHDGGTTWYGSMSGNNYT